MRSAALTAAFAFFSGFTQLAPGGIRNRARAGMAERTENLAFAYDHTMDTFAAGMGGERVSGKA